MAQRVRSHSQAPQESMRRKLLARSLLEAQYLSGASASNLVLKYRIGWDTNVSTTCSKVEIVVLLPKDWFSKGGVLPPANIHQLYLLCQWGLLSYALETTEQ
ncbi:hypothetical protein H6G80_34930 [Nostoc sp. FACHB-87]|uniref:hypothetical protein n=1 Tax=Nostocaceae TaxID=1162 RepID=UPI0016858F65|nr:MULTISPECIES: hypothetical protein [Nostocaceae]MBD2302230.1 hypothetical protein [Nostoc sp. FACHB-190]MBD2459219.1 hypothetical protein [Nostoc sp. FACHB-87]MBD2480226.1 hypothetical protein [Anabaena sp. FACHB-83]